MFIYEAAVYMTVLVPRLPTALQFPDHSATVCASISGMQWNTECLDANRPMENHFNTMQRYENPEPLHVIKVELRSDRGHF